MFYTRRTAGAAKPPPPQNAKIFRFYLSLSTWFKRYILIWGRGRFREAKGRERLYGGIIEHTLPNVNVRLNFGTGSRFFWCHARENKIIFLLTIHYAIRLVLQRSNLFFLLF